MTPTVLNRQTVRDEIAAGLSSAVAGNNKPVSSVYGYQKGKLEGETPVVLVLSGPIKRDPAGLGAKKYDNTVELEIHYLVYDGEKENLLSEKEREDKVDEIEALCAEWFINHQIGTSYRSLEYTNVPTEITTVTYLDGNPYRLEVAKVSMEAPDP